MKMKSKKLKAKSRPKAAKAKVKLKAPPKLKVKAKAKVKPKAKAKAKAKKMPKRNWPRIPKKELDAFHVDMPVPTNGTITSKRAAESIKHDTSRLRRLVWTTIYTHNGLICDEVEVMTNLKHQTASARIYELHTSGWLVDSGFKRRTRSKCLAIVWIPPKRLKVLRRLVKEGKVKVVLTPV